MVWATCSCILTRGTFDGQGLIRNGHTIEEGSYCRNRRIDNTERTFLVQLLSSALFYALFYPSTHYLFRTLSYFLAAVGS